MPRARISKISGFYVVTSHEAAASTRPVKRSTLLPPSFYRFILLSLSLSFVFIEMRIAFTCKAILSYFEVNFIISNTCGIVKSTMIIASIAKRFGKK